MSSGAVGKRYAKALFEVASEKNIIDAVEEELKSFNEVLSQNPAFVQLLVHPQIAKQKKKEEVSQVFAGGLSETLVNFINLLIDNDRQDAVGVITKYYVDLANEARGIVDARVISTNQLTENEEKEIKNRFSQLLNKEIRLQNEVDPSIMGGIIVQIGNRLYDGSVKGKLNRFKRKVVS